MVGQEVVEVVVEFAVTDLELELIGYHVVLEHLRNVVDIEFSLVGHDESVLHDLKESVPVVVLSEVVITICGVNLVVFSMVEHSCIQGVVRDEVGDLTLIVLDDPRVEHPIAG